MRLDWGLSMFSETEAVEVKKLSLEVEKGVSQTSILEAKEKIVEEGSQLLSNVSAGTQSEQRDAVSAKADERNETIEKRSDVSSSDSDPSTIFNENMDAYLDAFQIAAKEDLWKTDEVEESLIQPPSCRWQMAIDSSNKKQK